MEFENPFFPWVKKNKKNIRKTYLYNNDPIKPQLYIVKLGFTGYTLFFLFQLKNIECGYLQNRLTCFEKKYDKKKKNEFFLSENFLFLEVNN